MEVMAAVVLTLGVVGRAMGGTGMDGITMVGTGMVGMDMDAGTAGSASPSAAGRIGATPTDMRLTPTIHTVIHTTADTMADMLRFTGDMRPRMRLDGITSSTMTPVISSKRRRTIPANKQD